MANANVAVKKGKKTKAALPKKEKKVKPLEEETPRPIESTPTAFESDGYELTLDAETKLTVKQFRGRTYIDIRKFWNNSPTKKGISLTPELFRKIQQWTGLEEALMAIKKD